MKSPISQSSLITLVIILSFLFSNQNLFGITLTSSNGEKHPITHNEQFYIVPSDADNGDNVGKVNELWTERRFTERQGQSYTFEIVGGNTNNTFTINSNTGEILVNNRNGITTDFTLSVRVSIGNDSQITRAQIKRVDSKDIVYFDSQYTGNGNGSRNAPFREFKGNGLGNGTAGKYYLYRRGRVYNQDYMLLFNSQNSPKITVGAWGKGARPRIDGGNSNSKFLNLGSVFSSVVESQTAYNVDVMDLHFTNYNDNTIRLTRWGKNFNFRRLVFENCTAPNGALFLLANVNTSQLYPSNIYIADIELYQFGDRGIKVERGGVVVENIKARTTIANPKAPVSPTVMPVVMMRYIDAESNGGTGPNLRQYGQHIEWSYFKDFGRAIFLSSTANATGSYGPWLLNDNHIRDVIIDGTKSSHGIFFESRPGATNVAENTEINRVLIKNAAMSGIAVANQVKNINISYAVIHGSKDFGVRIDAGTNGTKIQNSILVDNNTRDINASASVQVTNSIFVNHSGTLTQNNNTNETNFFVDRASKNYRPKPNAPYLQKGVNLGFNLDKDRNPVGNSPSLGAYELLNEIKNSPPEINITAPAAGTEIEAEETISITAEASDEDGEVVKVELFVNGSSIGTTTQAPYSINWTADEAGTFEIRAVATDNEGASANSETVTVTVFETPENILPTVSITAPVSGTEIEAGETISITAEASDEDGEVVKVEFFVNGSSIGTTTQAPYSINWTADEAGTFEFRAVATDNEGASANSETVTVTVFETPENILPTVSITAPVSGTEIEAGSTVSITAEASDEDGEVVKVELFVNGSSIGTTTQAPYSINWTADEAGTFEIRAVATDNEGESANSETVTVTVFETPENILPTVSITAPVSGTEIEAGSTVSITAEASDEDGEVVKVELFVNGSSIGTTTQAPYSINWTADEAGTFEFRAVATDNEGASANSETVTVTVFETPENILPVVSITAPAAGTEIEAGETISITAEASDEDGEVVKVEFFVNGSSIGTTTQAPYSINWTADEAGTFEFRAVATDNEGASANSETVTVTVFETPENILPVVSITAPESGTEIEAGNTLTITADASDEDGEVVKVELFVNGRSIGTTTQAPYSINWTAGEAGTFEIRAVATDNEGASANSETVTVTVFETPENILPVVSITAPAAGTEIEAGETISITAEASDEDGEVVKVEFFVNGSSIGTTTQAPYSINWTADEAGTFEFRAVATDNEGASANSETVTVTVFETPENILPVVSITAPAAGTEIEAGETISITAEASDEDGEVVKVEFFVNGSSIGTTTQAPYGINWTADDAGTFEFRAVATDNEGASANSETVTVTVFETPENILPVVSITAPESGTEIEAGNTLTITAEASDQDGEVVKVEFFVNGSSIGTTTQAPYSINWTADEAGTFEFRAVATDNEGASANSETVTVTVIETPENILPVVSITAPESGTEIEAGNTLTITADASDEDGEVVKVELFVNGRSIGTTTQAPYSINWTAGEAGTFEIRAVATDNEGASANSETVTVTAFETPENILPVVSITAPAGGTEIETRETISITAEASDEDGEVVKVEFSVNGSSIGTTTQAPYSINWTADEAGTFEFRAVATDNEGASANSETVTVTVIETPENILPVVSITAPESGTEIEAGNTLTITADASDEDGEVVKVELFVNGRSIGTTTQAPYSINWTAGEAGTFEIRAVATDNEGASANSETVTVTAFETPENILPVVSITAPAGGTEIETRETISITAEASDEDGEVVKVEFFVNGSSIGTTTQAPYSINWTADEAGTFEIRAVATDNEGASANSETVTVTVFETPENILPTVSITAPVSGTEIEAGETISITAEASDEDGEVVKVEFFVNGSSIGTTTQAPYSINWTADEVGTFEIRAVATDNEGASANSQIITITVIQPRKPLAIKILSPSQNEVFARNSFINFEVEIESEKEVERVEYFRNNILIGVGDIETHGLSWRAMNLGNQNIRAAVIDVEGNTATSDVLRIRVENNLAPEVRLLSPIDKEEFALGTSIEIIAEAFDSDGYVDQVEFYANDVLIGTSFNDPFSTLLNNATPGTYKLTARAYDDKGASNTSSPITIFVIEEESNGSDKGTSDSPSVEVIIVSPGEGQEFEAGSIVPLIIMLDGEGDLVQRVEYFANGELIGTSTNDPFNLDWKASRTGNVELVAVAYGFENNRLSVSESRSIRILQNQNTFRIIDPIRDAVFVAGSDILIRVELPNGASEIEKVEFFRGNQKIGESNQFPYNFVWENVNQGQYNLVARLVYKDGRSELSVPVRISVSPRNNGNIRIKASKKEVMEGDSFELQVETTELEQYVDLIDIYMNDQLLEELEEEPYSLKLEDLPVGDYKFVARGKSKNTKGQVYYSEEVMVRVIPKGLEGIDVPDILLEIKIGPNPASDFINLIFENLDQDEQYDFTVQIVSMNGTVHDSYSFTQEGKVSTLDISNLKNGVYMMNLFYKNRQIESKRFIKRR